MRVHGVEHAVDGVSATGWPSMPVICFCGAMVGVAAGMRQLYAGGVGVG
jgi:hypothetical protein